MAMKHRFRPNGWIETAIRLEGWAITRYNWPSSVSLISSMVQMFGWSRADSVRQMTRDRARGRESAPLKAIIPQSVCLSAQGLSSARMKSLAFALVESFRRR